MVFEIIRLGGAQRSRANKHDSNAIDFGTSRHRSEIIHALPTDGLHHCHRGRMQSTMAPDLLFRTYENEAKQPYDTLQD